MFSFFALASAKNENSKKKSTTYLMAHQSRSTGSKHLVLRRTSPHLARMLRPDDDRHVLIALLVPRVTIDSQVLARHAVHKHTVWVVLKRDSHAAHLQVAVQVARVHQRERDTRV